MPDKIFEHPRLAAIYDAFDGQRHDLRPYLTIAHELQAKLVLDIGAGTGCLAELLNQEGFAVIAVEPAKASLDIARSKPKASATQWIWGDVHRLPSMVVDLAFMTGNVAQVFLTDDDLCQTLDAIHQVLQPSGHLVFEVRDPSKRAWQYWNYENTYQRQELPGIGAVEGWCSVTKVENKRVSFRWTYTFEADGETLVSDSTLRFWDKDEILVALEQQHYLVCEVRDAPDRPGQEFVFVATPK